MQFFFGKAHTRKSYIGVKIGTQAKKKWLKEAELGLSRGGASQFCMGKQTRLWTDTRTVIVGTGPPPPTQKNFAVTFWSNIPWVPKNDNDDNNDNN